METDRRTLLVALAALGVGAAGLASPAEAGRLGFRLASGARRADGGFAVLGVEPDGAVAFEIPLPGRAHGIACRPVEREAVVMARRPGSFAVVFDGADGTVHRLLAAPDGRRFYGHALYAPDGGLLYTTERADDGEDGVLGVWDARDGYARVG